MPRKGVTHVQHVQHDYVHLLRWLNTVFDTYVSFTFFSKTLDPLVVKNGSKQVNNTNFSFLIVTLTNMLLPWKHKEAFKIGFVYLQKFWSLDFLYNLHAASSQYFNNNLTQRSLIIPC